MPEEASESPLPTPFDVNAGSFAVPLHSSTLRQHSPSTPIAMGLPRGRLLPGLAVAPSAPSPSWSFEGSGRSGSSSRGCSSISWATGRGRCTIEGIGSEGSPKEAAPLQLTAVFRDYRIPTDLPEAREVEVNEGLRERREKWTKKRSHQEDYATTQDNADAPQWRSEREGGASSGCEFEGIHGRTKSYGTWGENYVNGIQGRRRSQRG